MSRRAGFIVDKAPDAFRTISEVADDLDVPQHVLRFWETRFPQIKPMKRGGGRRYYRPDDVDLLRGIRHLLYGQGYTIRGVQRVLKDNGLRFVQGVWKPDPSEAASPVADAPRAPGPDAADLVAEDGEDEIEAARAEAPITRPRGRPAPAAESVQAPPPGAAQPVQERAGLSVDDLQRLRSALDALAECRRLLDVALKDE